MAAGDVQYGNDCFVAVVHLVVVTLVDFQMTMVAVVDKDYTVVGNLQVLYEHKSVEVLELLLYLNLELISKIKAYVFTNLDPVFGLYSYNNISHK